MGFAGEITQHFCSVFCCCLNQQPVNNNGLAMSHPYSNCGNSRPSGNRIEIPPPVVPSQIPEVAVQVEKIWLCQNCTQPIRGGEVAIFAERAGSDKCWHPDCFSCSICHVSIICFCLIIVHHSYSAGKFEMSNRIRIVWDSLKIFWFFWFFFGNLRWVRLIDDRWRWRIVTRIFHPLFPRTTSREF